MKCKKHNTKLEWEERCVSGCHMGAVVVPEHWACSICEEERMKRFHKRLNKQFCVFFIIFLLVLFIVSLLTGGTK